VYALKAKKFEFLVHLDVFSKYLRIFLKNSLNEPKNSDFFASEAYTTFSHHFEPSWVILVSKLTT
jgi:hypothetical protein